MDIAMITPLFKWAVFLVASILALFCSIMMVTRKNPIHCALWLVVAFFSLAVIYLTLNAQFIAIAQVVVYAGAIMMLFIFVIMLIQLEKDLVTKTRFSVGKAIGGVITVILFLEIGAAFLTFGRFGKSAALAGVAPKELSQMGDVRSMGIALYGKYLFPFEIASILLLVGSIGAVALSKRRKD